MDGKNYTLEDAVEELAQLEAAAHEAKVAKDKAQLAHKVAAEKVTQARADILKFMYDEIGGSLNEETSKAKLVIALGSTKELVIVDEALLPEEFYELTPVRLDDKIKARIVSGVNVPGARIDETPTKTLRVTWKQK